MIEFAAQRGVRGDSLELYAKEQRDGKVYVITCAGMEVKEADANMVWPKFLDLHIQDGGAQSLFDALWKVGYRANSGESTVAHVDALKYHLEDMRKLVFKNA